MNVNANSHFSSVPQVNAQRSVFDMSHRVLTTFNVGELVPIHYQEVLPGDRWSDVIQDLSRMTPLVVPPMADLFLDFYFFFVPNRIVWDHWKDFMGENTKSAWYPKTEYNVPHVKFDATHRPFSGSVADYFFTPIGSGSTFSRSQLPFRAYALIWNEWFRDENLQDPVLVDTGDSDVMYGQGASDPSDIPATYGGALLKANRYHDYFSSCLPSPQKGPDVMLPLGQLAPVYSIYGEIADKLSHSYDIAGLEIEGMNGILSSSSRYLASAGKGTGSSGTGTASKVLYTADAPSSDNGEVYPSNLIADLTGVEGATINALRLALSTQAFYEKNARGGTRYRELIKSHFGVTSPDGRQQVPELLYYGRTKINFNQVIQQSASTDDSPLAHQAAYALTADADHAYHKAFTEHGMIIGLCTARYKHSYQQGLNRMFSRRTMFDYYFPVFANLGEQPVYNKEIYLSADASKNDEVFGYQEAWADYRYYPDYVTGQMRTGGTKTLDVYHWADYYKSLPALSAEWLEEDPSNVDRSLVVNHDVSDQIILDFYIKSKVVRCMPMYSIPGLPRTL